MTEEEKRILFDLIEAEITKYWGYTFGKTSAKIASKIADAIESKFAVVSFKEDYLS